MTLKFGTDGVRGVAGVDLTPELVVALGRAAVRALGARRAVPDRARHRAGRGRCSRPRSSPGICAEGGSAGSLGVLPTPGLAGACVVGRSPGGDDLGQPQPVPGQRHQVLRGRRSEAARRDRGRGSRPSSASILAERAVACATGTDIGTSRTCRGCGRRLRGAARSLAVAPDVLHGAARRRRLRQRRGVRGRARACSRGSAPTSRSLNAAPDGTNINDRLRLHRPERSRRRGAARAARTPGSRSTATPTGSSRSTSAVASSTVTTSSRSPRSTCRRVAASRGNAIATTVMANLGSAPRARGARHRRDRDAGRRPPRARGDGGARPRARRRAVRPHHLPRPRGHRRRSARRHPAARRDGARRPSRSPSSRASSPSTRRCSRNVRVARPRGPRRRPTGSGPRCAGSRPSSATDGRVLVRPSGTEPVVRVMVEASDEQVAEQAAARLTAALETALGAA